MSISDQDFLYPDEFENGFNALNEGVTQKNIDLIISVVKKLSHYPKYLLIKHGNFDLSDIQTASDCRFILRGDYDKKTQIIVSSAESLALAYELLSTTELLLQAEEIEECVSEFRAAYFDMLLTFNNSSAWEKEIQTRKSKQGGAKGGRVSKYKKWAHKAAEEIIRSYPNLKSQDKVWERMIKDNWRFEIESDDADIEVYVDSVAGVKLYAIDQHTKIELEPIKKSTFFKNYYGPLKNSGK